MYQLARFVRHEVIREDIIARLRDTFQTGGSYRFGWHLELKLHEDQYPQGAARDVDAFPERIGSQQNRGAGIAEAAEQLIALPLTLNQERPAPAQLPADRVGGAAQRPVAREQREDAAVGRVRQLEQHARHRGSMSGLVV